MSALSAGGESGINDTLNRIDELLRQADGAVDVLLRGRLADLRKKYVEAERMERAVQLELIRTYSENEFYLSKVRGIEDIAVAHLRDAAAAAAKGGGRGGGEDEVVHGDVAKKILELVYSGDENFQLLSSKEQFQEEHQYGSDHG